MFVRVVTKCGRGVSGGTGSHSRQGENSLQHGKHLKLVFHELSPQVDRVLVLNDVDDGGPQTNSKLGDSVWRKSARNLSFIR